MTTLALLGNALISLNPIFPRCFVSARHGKTRQGPVKAGPVRGSLLQSEDNRSVIVKHHPAFQMVFDSAGKNP